MFKPTTLKIATVILHYGEPKITKALHHQLLKDDPQIVQNLFVLDNNAPKPYHKSWKRLPKNLYWTGALEFCLDFFLNKHYDYLWFLNNDLIFTSKGPILTKVQTRIAYLEKKLGKVGIYSPSFSFNPYHPQMSRQKEKGFIKVSYIDGIAPAVNLKCYKNINGLDCDNNLYGYGVDIWLSLRTYLQGWPVVVDQEIEAKHFYHATAKTIGNFLNKAKLQKNTYLRKRLGPNFTTILKKLQTAIYYETN